MSLEYYQLYRLAIWLVNHLPQWFVFFVAGTIAEINFIFSPRSRRGVYTNQAHALPPETGWLQRWRCARAAFRYFAYSVVDFFRIPLMNPQNLDRFVAGIDGLGASQRGDGRGQGRRFRDRAYGKLGVGRRLHGHARRAGDRGPRLPHQDPRIDQIFLESRLASGMEIVSVGGALRKLQDAVVRGRYIGLVADRESGHGPRLPFFGETTRVPIGHASLALSTGAWICQSASTGSPTAAASSRFARRSSPIPLSIPLKKLTRQCLSVLEAFICVRRPEQWSSFFDLWHATELPVA